MEGERLSFHFFTWLDVITWSEGHYGWVSLIINDHSAKFGSHLPSRGGNILFLTCHVTTWSEDHVTLWVSSSHYKSSSCQVWLSQSLCKRRNFVFCLSRDLTWLRSQRFMWHYGWVSVVISDYPAKLEDHRPFGTGDIKVSISHVSSRDHIVRGSGDIMGEFPVKFGGHRIFGIEDIKFLICHVTTWSEGRVTSWVSCPHHKPLHCHVLWSYASQKRRYFVFHWSSDLTSPHGQ